MQASVDHTHPRMRGRAFVMLLAGVISGLFTPAPTLAQRAAEPSSLEELFGSPRPEREGRDREKATPKEEADQAPASLDALFGQKDAKPSAPALKTDQTGKGGARAQSRLTGFYQNELAYAYRDKTHWSKFRNTLELKGTGADAGGVKWTLGGRLVYDPIYDLTDHYPAAVRKDQRLELKVREAYVDLNAGDWEFRLGRQHIVWGEMVGLFFADVVSAKDLRELALQEFDLIRIPQWAARAEYYAGDLHLEGVWIPYMSYDNIGRPGAEFYPFPAVPGVAIAQEKRPLGLSESAYGLRLSYLTGGWDLAGFYYSANDTAAAFERLTPTLYRPIHERIRQLGGTLGKDLGPLVLKAEAVYTWDKLFSVTDLTVPRGLLTRDILDAIVGLEWSFPQETRLNVQYYQRWFADAPPPPGLDRSEGGMTLLLSSQALHPKLEPKVLIVRSLNRDDTLVQLKATWRLDGNWRLAAGADLFAGDRGGLFGRYADRDRIYTEVRYSF